jgi:hypothetical protein
MLSFLSQLFFCQMQLSRPGPPVTVSILPPPPPPPLYSMTRVRDFVANLAKTGKSF